MPERSSSPISDVVRVEIEIVADEQGKQLPGLEDSLPLLDSGLDSLCLAILVARLEDRLRIDPFSADGAVTFPVTIGDLIEAYERATA